MKMINREKEKDFLEKKIYSNKSELIILYGRRRVGKTFLLEKTFEEKAVFFTADLSNTSYLINRFSREIISKLPNFPGNIQVNQWDDFFGLLKMYLLQNRDKIIIFDEFQYIPFQDSSFMSIFQRWWDTEFSKMNVNFILCGSYSGMIEKIALEHNSPLYGRRTGQYKILPMDFFDSSKFLPNFNIEDKIYIYSITDGIPLYLKEFSEFSNFEEALFNRVFSPGEFLVEEGKFLTMEEFKKDPSNYFSIMRVIADGKTTPVEISNFSGVENRKISTYLSKLLDVELIKKEFPVSLKKPKRKPLYYINDEYIKFYFKYIFPNIDIIYRGHGEQLVKSILLEINNYTSFTFEKIARQYIERVESPQKIGKWWNKDIEIDIAAIKENKVIVGECKWTNKKVDNRVLQKLQLKTQKMIEEWNFEPDEIIYYLFSKSGFTNILEAENIKLIDLESLSELI
ncbi:putative ATPase (AAA+ superfamily) [Marinitoga piezophila KA3]|uniref:Putative ATPase (AAA+ superfamily) n=1 Tax=Marinitoga piezophila (strain DSM 14283 / JCM 11233 / KA3) TaxID=443254 RepID=H2J7W0_MARPK|nr:MULTISPECIES: ATP-binding protein [Marinitoga]AEX85451.1 putative ATPase (AAA+ superfamily) [Marinitoga piezophila KA3]NUU97599.1 ATPase [Marinitoga sp. 1138]